MLFGADLAFGSVGIPFAEAVKALFGAEYAYVQPHSGIDANLVAFWAILSAKVEAPAMEKGSMRPPYRTQVALNLKSRC